ncbi:MAG: polyketide cyclase [Herpetosiphonaceae bacterium]|nr:polyketide cyclase [Herpetosiphonaceae bacterium]
MAANDYHFITHWTIEGTIKEVVDILADASDLPRWWPSVYLNVQELAAGDEQGIGKVVDLYTKGWLPYTLCWQFRVAEIYLDGLSIEASGDFDGRGVWTFGQNGPFVDIVYDWRIRAGKPLLRRLSWLLKPIFAANHRWAMAQGETSLKLELARLRAAGEHVPLPPPPAATSSGPFLGLGAVVIMIGLGYWLAQRIRDRGGV